MVTALAREELRRVAVDRPTALTIGVFDGVHRGHHALLRRVVTAAQKDNLASAAVTFHPHPRQVIHPTSRVEYLTSFEDRLDLLLGFGLDCVAPVTFTSELAQSDAGDFVRLLVEELQMKKLVMGPDFALGRRRTGDPAALSALGREIGFEVEVVELLEDDAAKVSSSEIRAALARGDMERVNHLLGRNFSLQGPVVVGFERGRNIGFPTANIAVGADRALPATGVYATIAQLSDGPHVAVTNIGVRPTFDDVDGITVECHILDFEGDIYGRELRIELICRIRGEVKFDDVKGLKEQIFRDCAAAREALLRLPEERSAP